MNGPYVEFPYGKYLKASWIRTDMDEHLFRLLTYMEPGEGKGIFSHKRADRAQHGWEKEREP